MKSLPHGSSATRKALFDSYAAYGCPRSLQRHMTLRFGRKRQRRVDAGTSSPFLVKVAEEVAEKKLQAFSLSGRWVSTENAIKLLQEAEKLPYDGLPSLAAINGYILKHQLLQVTHNYDVLHCKNAHELHVADTSGSLVFRTTEYTDDPIIETCPASDSSSFKNHPQEGRRQIYLFAMIDAHSGHLWAEYRSLPSPNSHSMAGFLLNTWKESCVPLNFLSDHGRENLGAVDSIIEALGINRIKTKPRNPRGRGVIERCFRTIFQSFEAPFILKDGPGKKFPLSSLNEKLKGYLMADFNSKPARLTNRNGGVSRYEVCSQR